MAKGKMYDPTPKYKKDYARMAEVACAEGGFTDHKLGLLFNVARSAISRWKHRYPEFKAALDKGKDHFDTEVIEKAFFKRCSGYYYTETVKEPEEVGSKKMVVVRRTRKHVVPDTKGCMDWLCNRAPDRWKKVKHVEITGQDGGPVKTESMVEVPSGPMTIAQWEKEVRQARKSDLEIEPGMMPGDEKTPQREWPPSGEH